MARLSAARRAALALAGERRRRGARARDLLRGSEALSELDERDRGLAVRLVMGVTAAEGALDVMVDAHLRRGARLEPRVRDALRIAAFELVYLGTRSDVAVSQGVELVRSVAPRAAGLANAVLRRVAEEDVAAVADARARVVAGTYDTSDLALVGALPEWLAERVGTRALTALEPAAPWVAANVQRGQALFHALEEAGCEPQEGPLPRSYRLGAPSRLAPSGLVERADVIPCDLAAQEVALACVPAPGERVLEVGQGRGTKTLLLQNAAIAAGGPCEITAVEVSPRKSELARRRMEAAGVADHVRRVCADGRALPEDLGTFDLVFLDAPCSGTGTLARHPEIAWSLDPSAPAELAALQAELLASAAAHVAPGGRLVYATCSVLAEENDAVIRAFLASPAGAPFELVGSGLTEVPGGSDTHFHAHLRRTSAICTLSDPTTAFG
ncbi:methyltransferase domain-containing protein [Olsenella sp. DSM 107455]|uniref:Methyltransferase domain-containing protein n=1 Tax=Thermophilibacter gallinarum TaxID=2779357 RepID=A0ABR9QSC2_9ACTN|nr:methyltransferase domain-containing protein [Thermophilibacter gallinarum]